ncbi:MAG TPA: hypothetical protein VI794_03265 [Patescibacteria group bacterium]|nr:hypothetical protein [Patescibacteria group bacterium]
MSCSDCHYLLTGSKSPSGRSWCGWMGGDPTPGDPQRCHHVPLQQARLPEGFAIAKSHRVVAVADLAAENENFADVSGRLD